MSFYSGKIAGFDDFFSGSSSNLSSMLVGLVGTQRFEASKWLNNQAKRHGKLQHVTELNIQLHNTYKERINGKTREGLPSSEFDLIKPTVGLRDQLIGAWSNAVMESMNIPTGLKIDLLSRALSSKVNKIIPISSILFSRALEKMPESFQNARAIYFSAMPVEADEWHGNPPRLIAFRKESIIKCSRMEMIGDD